MFRDAREIPSGARLDTDVCIVGGGVAGVILAREFARQEFRTCVVESGGLQPDAETQELARGAVVGEPTNEPITTRRRQFGGTAHIWDSQLGGDLVGFRCAPLDPVDFERREAVPDSGWPLDRAHLDSYYERAQAICGLGPHRYDAVEWAGEDAPLFPVDDAVLSTSVWQFGRQELFLRTYPAELQASPAVTVLLHASVTSIETHPDGRSVTGVKAATLQGGRFTISAGVVILAAGGLENPRLLLLSDDVHARGLGNERDLVGRYFMEHPFVRAGTLVPFDRRVFDRAGLFDVTMRKGTVVMAKWSLTGEVLRREGLLNSCMLLLPAHGTHKPESVDALKALLRSALRGRLPDRAGRLVGDVTRGLDFIGVSILRKLIRRRKLFPYIDWGPGITGGAGWSSWPEKAKRFSVFDAYLLTEQPPLAYNRVRLDDERDALGCRRLALDWRWDDLSRRSILRTEQLMADAIRSRGFGRLKPLLDGGQPFLQYPAQHHHLGTTRMHEDPARGVVDANARVHGVANLFIAGGSVFPTGGYINPTLTIAALSLRLADHVAAFVSRGAAIEAQAG